MGTLDHGDKRMTAMSDRDGGVVFVASRQQMPPLRTADGQYAVDAATTLELPSDEPVPNHALVGKQVLVIEIDPASARSTQRLGEVRAAFPDLAIVGAIRNPSIALVRTLVRQGVTDVVSLPFDRDEVEQVVLDALARSGTTKAAPTRLAPLISVVRSIGGCGATTIATHLAAELGERRLGGRPTLIADLDIQFGTVIDYLGVNPSGRLSDLLDAGRLDEDMLRSVAVQVSDDLAILAAPETIMPLEQINIEQLLRVIELLRRQYGAVVLDLPADWTNWTLSAVAQSDLILMVVEQSLPSIRQAKRRLNLLRSVGIEDKAIQLVVNRVEKRLFGSISTDDVAETIGRPVLGSIALEDPLVGASQNQGQLVTNVRRKSRFAKDIVQLTDSILARVEGA